MSSENFNPTGVESDTIDIAPSDSGSTKEHPLDKDFWKAKCGRCSTLVPESKTVCGNCGLKFPHGYWMEGWK